MTTLGGASCQVSDAEIQTRGWHGSDGNDAGEPNAGSAGSGATSGDNATAGSGSTRDAGLPTSYDNPDASTVGEDAAQAGSGGGVGSEAGSGGSDSPVAGSGGSAGSAAARAGSGGSDSPVAGSGGSTVTCPTEYAVATHIVINVSWSATLALNAGSGKVHVWTKSLFVEDGDNASIESQSCGSALPPITTNQVFAGGEKILPEIPDAAWDAPDMPRFYGSSTRNGDSISINPGVALVGLTLSNPTATWPSASSIIGVDHDDDGELGITAVAKQDEGYSAPPTNLSRSSRADKLYLAIRNIMTLNATVSGCPDSYSGTANVTNFDNHVIGCHVKGGNECDSTQIKFEDDNRTVYKLGSATFTAERVSADATCADVRAAVP